MLPSPLPLLMLLAMSSSPTPASVHLVFSTPDASADTQASVERVRGWLLLRLIEDGYTVAPTDAEAGVRLSVVLSDGQWGLHVVGKETRSDVVAGSSGSIASLKMIHRALALLSGVSPRDGVSAPQRIAVARSSREGSSGDAADRALEALVSELERAGVAVAREYPGAKIACVVGEGESLGVGVGEDDEQCLERARARANSEPGSLGAQVEHWSAYLGNESASAIPEPTPVTGDVLPAAEPVRDVPEPTPADPSSPLRLWGHVGLGWEHRSGGSDPFVRAQLDWMREHGFGFRLQGDLLQSGPPALNITEVEAQGGVVLGFELGGSASVVVSALAGARFHRYVFGQDDAETRIAPVGSFPAEFVVRGSSVRFALGAGLTVAAQPTRHEVGEHNVWRRGALGYSVFLTLGASP